MSETPENNSVFDSSIARFIAAGIALGCLIALYLLSYLSDDKVADGKVNPKFVVCRDERVAQFEELATAGAISEEQLNTFTERAISICAQKFPPEG